MIEMQDFDRADQANTGRPNFFNVDMFLDIVEQMIVADETERALLMLDNMPGFYRDHVPDRARTLKDRLLRKLYTTADYIGSAPAGQIELLRELPADQINDLYMTKLTRAQVALALCQSLNKQGIKPHIHEVAPGSYWLPIGLKKNEVQFTYQAVSLDGGRNDQIRDFLGDSWAVSESDAQIFICYELIEHLANPTEIYQHYLKANRPFSHVLLSTPKYTVSTAVPNWYDAELGHLRTYTPAEFGQFAHRHWPKYEWSLYQDEIMVLCGKRSGQ